MASLTVLGFEIAKNIFEWPARAVLAEFGQLLVGEGAGVFRAGRAVGTVSTVCRKVPLGPSNTMRPVAAAIFASKAGSEITMVVTSAFTIRPPNWTTTILPLPGRHLGGESFACEA